jgi:chromosome segregation ATPase
VLEIMDGNKHKLFKHCLQRELKCELQRQLQSCEREKRAIGQRLEAELTSAEETARISQQALQEMRQRVVELVQAKESALQQLRQKEELLKSTEAVVADFQRSLQQKDSELETLKKMS